MVCLNNEAAFPWLRAVQIEVVNGAFSHGLQRLVLAAHGDPVPVCIVRPSGIGALAGEPCPGYIGNPSGMTAFILAGVAGESPATLVVGVAPAFAYALFS